MLGLLSLSPQSAEKTRRGPRRDANFEGVFQLLSSLFIFYFANVVTASCRGELEKKLLRLLERLLIVDTATTFTNAFDVAAAVKSQLRIRIFN